jgi:hypothetical protein
MSRGSGFVTIIEIRPFRNGWEVFESAGVQPVFLTKEQAIDYAICRACFRCGNLRLRITPMVEDTALANCAAGGSRRQCLARWPLLRATLRTRFDARAQGVIERVLSSTASDQAHPTRL